MACVSVTSVDALDSISVVHRSLPGMCECVYWYLVWRDINHCSLSGISPKLLVDSKGTRGL